MINLLPEEGKKEFIMERKIKIVTILGTLSLVFLVFLGVLLFSVKIYILSQLQSEKTSFNLENLSIDTPEIKALEKNTKELNQKISQLNSFYKEQTSISQVLEEISNILPSETYLTSFSYQKEKSQVNLFGFAKTRENLLDFKKSLENQKNITNIYSPISNLTKPIDIDFFFSFNLAEE